MKVLRKKTRQSNAVADGRGPVEVITLSSSIEGHNEKASTARKVSCEVGDSQHRMEGASQHGNVDVEGGREKEEVNITGAYIGAVSEKGMELVEAQCVCVCMCLIGTHTHTHCVCVCIGHETPTEVAHGMN